jgi:predicted TIM-barrel fold metal-dependent hydrolase
MSMGTNGVAVPVIDGDGHVFEDMKAIARLLPDQYRQGFERGELTNMFPPLDHFHQQPMIIRGFAERVGQIPGVPEWKHFLKEVGIERTVLYPSIALSYGKIRDRDWAITICRAYNDWLYETYLTAGPEFKGVCLLPMQEPSAAVEELERSVKELGMVGGMMPARGLPLHLGSKEYWPVYETAAKLDCMLAIHGGCHDQLGFDDMNVYGPVHALGHPMGQLISLAGIVFNGIFDRLPKLRVAFWEGGAAWVLMALERMEESYETHLPFNDRGELVNLEEGEDVRDYIIKMMKRGNIRIGCEGGE